MKAIRVVLVLSALAALAGCSRGVLSPDSEAREQTLTRRYDGPGGLVQTIRVSRAEPSPGDTLRIESVITNEGDQPVNVTSRICGLDLQTELRFGPQFRCGGFSRHGPLAPGASIRESEGGVVTSRPGTYSVRLRHLLEPEKWVSFQITVRGR